MEANGTTPLSTYSAAPDGEVVRDGTTDPPGGKRVARDSLEQMSINSATLNLVACRRIAKRTHILEPPVETNCQSWIANE
jgi:hypothetical protein